MAQRQDKQKTSSDLEIPDYAIQRIARCMFPMLQQYYESKEGQRELAEREERRKEK